MRQLAESLAVRAFIDSTLIHKLWGCHRRADRSFFLRGRQFHVCARCTGLITGIPCSIFLLPLRELSSIVFMIFAMTLLIDGITQFAGLRESNNTIRFATGFGTAAAFLPSAISFAEHL